MRFAWTVAGDDPDFNQGDKYGIDGYFYPMFDPLTTTTEIQKAAAHPGIQAVGIYFGHNWDDAMGFITPGQIATAIRDEYRRVTQGLRVLPQLRIMYNDEDKKPAKIIAVLEQLRVWFPKKGLSWSPEGMQGGWIGPVVTPTQGPSDFVQRLIKAKVRVVPQGFWGAEGTIQGDWAHDMVLRDLTRRGLPEGSVSIFHDGKTLAQKRNAEGFVFTMGRLPFLS